MPTSLQKFFETWRDQLFENMTPRQRALLKNGHRVWVKVGGAKVLVCPADHPSQKNVTEIPISFSTR